MVFQKKVIRNEQGVAMIWALILFTMITILTFSSFLVLSQDLFETTQQELRLRTYYIAMSGIELTYGMLYDDDNRDDIIESIMDGGPISDVIPIVIEGNQVGTATVTISRVFQDDVDWLRVVSVGQLEGESVRTTAAMRINEKKPDQFIKEQN